MKKSVNVFFTASGEAENRYYVENFEANVDDFNNYVSILSKYIDNEVKVLDLGCAQGRFGKVLNEKKCDIIGVELDKIAAEYAIKTGYYRDVIVGDMTNTNVYNKIRENGKFNYIIATDILEHVVDPTDLITRYYQLLEVGGCFIISIPNFANIKVVLDLLNNQIAYSNVGILDNTHIKWFTKRNFIEWIKQINTDKKNIHLDCEYLGATDYRNEFVNEVIAEYPKLYEILLNNENINSLQLLFRLRKIREDEKTVCLNNLLSVDEKDVVDILGKTLDDKKIDGAVLDVSTNDRIKYEKYISKLEESVNISKKGWEDAVESNEMLNVELKKSQEGWSDTFNRLNDALASNEDLNKELDKAQKGWSDTFDRLNDALESNAIISKELEEARKGWTDCAENWKKALQTIDFKEQEVSRLKEYYDSQNQFLKEKIEKMYVRFDNLESSMEVIMKRDLELQRELNDLKKEKSNDN